MNAPLPIVVAGHVDHGKSTLIGSLLHHANALPQGKLEQVQQLCKAQGRAFEFAFLLDALLEEQAQNVTLDTTQIHWRSPLDPQRHYVIIDTPGHHEFIKNMVTGAARAQAAILVADVREGAQAQTREHARLLSLLGIRHVIVAVNKMDAVTFDAAAFERASRDISGLLKQIGLPLSAVVPIAARTGDHLITPSPAMPWHAGPTLTQALDALPPAPSLDQQPLRLVVQDVYRLGERRLIVGRVESGRLQVGQELMFWPGRKSSHVASIEAWNAASPPLHATAGQSIALTLSDPIFVERGSIGAHPSAGLAQGRRLRARIFWLDGAALPKGGDCTLKLATQSVQAHVEEIHAAHDISALEEAAAQPPASVQPHQIAEVTLRTRHPIAFDNAEVSRATGRMALERAGRICGGGIVIGANYAASHLPATASDNITWTDSHVTLEQRRSHFHHRGAVIWMTGLSGAGKSTLATALEAALFERGIGAYVLDGDNLRHGLCADLGFSEAGRKENIRRAAEAAKLLAEAGLVAIVALISPYAAAREQARAICSESGVAFAEVYINSPLAVCEARDPRQLYARARAGEIRNFTGIDEAYEPPREPELEVRTDAASKPECLHMLLALALQLARPSER